MKTVLICGAGKSSTYLIDYMLNNAKNNWRVIVMDNSSEAVAEKLGGHPKGEAAIINIMDEQSRKKVVQKADIVISVMPPHLHIILAKDCIEFKKNLITASYVSPEIMELDQAAKDAGLLFMCEMGLDPGIDHMSANDIIHSVERISGDITSFKSYCGGLVAPESNDNPWGYKISWNPRNIVNAGKVGGTWIENGKEVSVDYQGVYYQNKKIKVELNDVGNLAYYPNRDSKKYLNLYNLPSVKTFLRATLRYPQFSKAWHYVVKANLTDDQDEFVAQGSCFRDWLCWKTNLPNSENLKQLFVEKYEVDEKSMKQLEWLGVFDEKQIYENKSYSSADLLQILLEEKWQMKPLDKDMVVMVHQVEYKRKDIITKLTSTMVAIGENRNHSAMAKTVGLPMAILAKRILMNNEYTHLTGVQIPVMPEVYVPILKELSKYGVEFIEKVE